jgi:outer membrane protein OmpA-like peptidoglycan-associated protein
MDFLQRRFVMKKNSFLALIPGSILVSVFLTGCASAPPHNTNLDAAMSAYQTASQDPSVMQAAPEQLQKASSAIDKAKSLYQKNPSDTDVDHYAYLAKRRVEIANEKAENDTIQSEIKKAGAQRDALMLQSKQQKIDQLRDQLSSMKAKNTNRGLVLTLGSVLFDVNRASLKSGATQNVDKLAQFMNADPKRNVMIEGYTDNTGKAQYNKILSLRRAESVRDALVSDGINPQRIITKGYGAKYPVASNKTSAGRQENRRVEVVISDENGRFPKSR